MPRRPCPSRSSVQRWGSSASAAMSPNLPTNNSHDEPAPVLRHVASCTCAFVDMYGDNASETLPSSTSSRLSCDTHARSCTPARQKTQDDKMKRGQHRQHNVQPPGRCQHRGRACSHLSFFMRRQHLALHHCGLLGVFSDSYSKDSSLNFRLDMLHQGKHV